VGAISVVVADFNGDTRPDLAVTITGKLSVALLNDTPGNPDRSDYFVHQHYLDFLEREPDSLGFEYWRTQIDQCSGDANCVRETRIGTSAAFFIEPEFRESGYFVHRLYQASYGRRPVYSEFKRDRQKVVGGPDLEASKTAFLKAFMQSDAFSQAYSDSLSNADFVNKLYDTAGLTPFAAERLAAIALLNQGGGRDAALRTLIENTTFKERDFNPAFVQMQYFGYLRRDEDQRGYDFWLDVMNQQPNNYRRMVCAFITSEEYQQRFEAAVTHTNAECEP
jgi:hypothetical protein